MDRERSGSISCPPYFDGEDYTQWKVMMQAFLQSLDENIWNIVENGWEHPIKPVESKTAEGSSAKTELKPRSEWLTSEIRDYNNDVKARNSLFTALSKREKKTYWDV